MESVFNFSLFSSVLSLIYLVLGFLFVLIFAGNMKKVDRRTILSLFTGFFIYYGFFLTNHLLSLKTIAPDTYFYANIIKDFWNSYGDWSLGVKAYALINIIPIYFSLSYPELFIPINISLFFAGVVLGTKAFMKWMHHRQQELAPSFMSQVLLLAAFYPVGIIVIPSLLREGAMIFFFGLTLYLLTVLATKSRPVPLLLPLSTALAWLLLTLIRPIGGISLLSGVLLLYLLQLYKKRSIRQLVVSLLAVVVFIVVLNKVADAYYNIKFSIDWLSKYRAGHESLFGIEAYGTQLNWSNIFETIISGSYLFFQYLLSPFPVIIPVDIALKKTIPSLDALLLLFGLITLFSVKRKAVRPLFLIAFMLVLIPSLFETHISGAYRHRMNLVVFLLPLLALGWSNVLRSIKNSSTPEL